MSVSVFGRANDAIRGGISEVQSADARRRNRLRDKSIAKDHSANREKVTEAETNSDTDSDDSFQYHASSIIVRNIDARVTVTDLRNHFAKHGKVESCYLDEPDGTGLRNGYLSYFDRHDAFDAIALHDSIEFFGRRPLVRLDRLRSPVRGQDVDQKPTHRNQSPSRKLRHVSKIIAVDKAILPLIIGRGGATIMRIRAQAGAHINVTKSVKDSGMIWHLEISGPPTNVARAEAEIMNIIVWNTAIQSRGKGSPTWQVQDSTSSTQARDDHGGDSEHMLNPRRSRDASSKHKKTTTPSRASHVHAEDVGRSLSSPATQRPPKRKVEYTISQDCSGSDQQQQLSKLSCLFAKPLLFEQPFVSKKPKR